MTAEERKNLQRISNAWRSGEKIEGLRFSYNSTVKATLPDGSTAIGWIVGVEKGEGEPIYTIEFADGSGDEECSESKLEALENPN